MALELRVVSQTRCRYFFLSRYIVLASNSRQQYSILAQLSTLKRLCTHHQEKKYKWNQLHTKDQLFYTSREDSHLKETVLLFEDNNSVEFDSRCRWSISQTARLHHCSIYTSNEKQESSPLKFWEFQANISLLRTLEFFFQNIDGVHFHLSKKKVHRSISFVPHNGCRITQVWNTSEQCMHWLADKSFPPVHVEETKYIFFYRDARRPARLPVLHIEGPCSRFVHQITKPWFSVGN